MKFGKLDINPAKNPAVLDTATWDPQQAWRAIAAAGAGYWRVAHDAASGRQPPPSSSELVLHPRSLALHRGSVFGLATLPDLQHVLVGLGGGTDFEELGKPIGQLSLGGAGDARVSAYPATLDTVARYVDAIDPSKGPRALAGRPRLGLGSRMTTASWPGSYRAMSEVGFAANAIQNSMREVVVLADLLQGRRGEPNYGPNLGTFESGHTGSSWEGLWLYGVLEALKAPRGITYGAEADHIQVKRGAGGLERALRTVDSARHYTFFTLDVSDILDYGALNYTPAVANEIVETKMPGLIARREVMAAHKDAYRAAGRALRLDEQQIERFIAKYWDALDAMESLAAHIGQLKTGRPYDLEFAIDEVPAGLTACECITSSAELLFIVRECQRRGIPLTHIAPNIGVEKEIDYRCSDGLSGMEARVREQTEFAMAEGLMLDFHSGDDLTRETRRAIGRATRGHCHFKLSPALQLLYAETLDDVCPEKFRVWWDDTLAFARREADKGSALAIVGLQAFAASQTASPSATHAVFRHYCFASVGRRDEAGQYVMREMFYDVPEAFRQEYGDRLLVFLGQVADDLFGQG
jgi:hypothetical protein